MGNRVFKVLRFRFFVIPMVLVVLTCCQKNSKEKKIEVKDQKDTLVYVLSGLPNNFLYTRSRIAYAKLGVDYVAEGCLVSKWGIENNKKVAKILEQRHGKYWEHIFKQSCLEELDNWYSVINLIKVNKKIIQVKNSYENRSPHLTLHMKSMGKFDYAARVYISFPEEEDYNDKLLCQFLVNVQSKKVTEKKDLPPPTKDGMYEEMGSSFLLNRVM